MVFPESGMWACAFNFTEFEKQNSLDKTFKSDLFDLSIRSRPVQPAEQSGDWASHQVKGIFGEIEF